MKNTRNGLNVAVLLVISLVFSAGCARDRDYDDYRRDELAEDTEALSEIVGVYTGTLQSQRNQQNLGTLALTLEPDLRVSSLTEGQAVLRGEVRFWGNNLVKLVFSDSYYDAEKGTFKSVVNVPDVQGNIRAVELVGKIESGKLKGHLALPGYLESSGSFSLEHQVQLAAAANPFEGYKLASEKVENFYSTYSGEALHADGSSEPVRMILSNSDLGPIEQFLDLLAPTRRLQLSLSAGRLNLVFDHSELDFRTGVITGRQAGLNRENSRQSLSCQPTQDETLGDGFQCRFQSSERGVIINLKVFKD